MDEDDLTELYGESVTVRVQEPQENVIDGKDDEAEDQDDDETESDDEIEFVIDTKPGTRAEPPQNKPLPYSAIKIVKPGTSTSVLSAGPASTVKLEPRIKVPVIDLNAIAELDGKSILEADLESLEHKPWRQPGADITDYFNYGFDEFTWTAYCQKQTNLREDFNPQKVMATMMGGDMNMGMGMMPGMPPFGMEGMMMDPMVMQQMMGQMPPNMSGMPNMNQDMGYMQQLPPPMPSGMPIHMQQQQHPPLQQHLQQQPLQSMPQHLQTPMQGMALGMGMGGSPGPPGMLSGRQMSNAPRTGSSTPQPPGQIAQQVPGGDPPMGPPSFFGDQAAFGPSRVPPTGPSGGRPMRGARGMVSGTSMNTNMRGGRW